LGQSSNVHLLPDHNVMLYSISLVLWLFKIESQARLVLMNWELSYIHVSDLKVEAISFQVEVPVQFSWATSDLWLIQQNKFHWISHRSMVAQLNCTVTQVDDLILTIWPYHFFDTVQSDRRFELTLCFRKTCPVKMQQNFAFLIGLLSLLVDYHTPSARNKLLFDQMLITIQLRKRAGRGQHNYGAQDKNVNKSNLQKCHFVTV